MVCWLLLVLKGIVGSDGVRFHNGALGGSNAGCAGIAEFLVPVFESSSGSSASAGYGVSFAESVECVKVDIKA